MNGWKIRPGIVLAEVQGVSFLAADREDCEYCPYVRRVNEIGAFIWKRLEEGNDRPGIIRRLREEYDIPEGYDIEADVNAFLEELKQERYMIHEAGPDEI